MKFGESIDNVLFKNYFNLEGKATRSEFWWFMLFFLIFNLVVGVVVGIILGISMGPNLDPEALELRVFRNSSSVFFTFIRFNRKKISGCG